MTAAKPRHKQLPLSAAILVLSLTLATSNLLIQPAMAQLDHDVSIHDLSFNPQCLCIEKGDAINWTNNDPVIHTLWFVFTENQSTYLLSDPIPPGESWAHSFTESQKFALVYYSFDHLWITGTLRVYRILGDVDGDGDVDPGDFYIFSGAYGTAPASNIWCDLDCDNDVDPGDFYIFSGKYGKTNP